MTTVRDPAAHPAKSWQSCRFVLVLRGDLGEPQRRRFAKSAEELLPHAELQRPRRLAAGITLKTASRTQNHSPRVRVSPLRTPGRTFRNSVNRIL